MGATARIANPELTVEPGSEVILDVLVHNSGSQVDEFTLEVLGDAAGWTEIGPAVLRLFPGQEQVAQIVFRPPRAATTLARIYPFAVKVVSHEDPNGSAVEEGRLKIEGFQDTTAELLPKTSKGSTVGRHRIAVDNRGNTPLSAEVAAADGSNAARFELQPRAIAAQPGTAQFVRLKVRPRTRFLRGEPKTIAFDVSVRPKGQTPIRLQGSMLQQPMVPGWLPKVALVLVAAIVGCVLLWFLALKPAVQSAAREAMAPTVHQQEQAIAGNTQALDTLQKKVDGGGGGGGGGSQPKPTPTPGATTGATAATGALGDPYNGTLTTNSPTYTVPDKSTLSIVTIELYNPNGDKGSLVKLRADSTDFAVYKLDNFRAQDIQYGAPLTLTAGQKLTFVASNTSAFVQFTGYLKKNP